MNIKSFLVSECPVSITVSVAQLKEFFLEVWEEKEKAVEAAMKAAEQERYLEPNEASEMLGVTANTLWRWNRDGYLKPIKVGRKNRYKLSEVKSLMEGGKQYEANI